VMARDSKGIGRLSFRLVALVLLGCPRAGSAAGTWSEIPLPQKAGDVLAPTALAVDGGGNLYVADQGLSFHYRVQQRDAQGNWTVIATEGKGLGQVDFFFGEGLAADTAGSLYIASGYPNAGIQERDAQG